MKQNVFILAAAAMLAASCSVSINGNGGSLPPAGSAKAAVHAAESAAAKGFTGIRINGGYDVYYTPGAQTSIRLEGDADCIRRTIVENKGNTLIISPAKGKGFSSRTIKTSTFTSPPLQFPTSVLKARATSLRKATSAPGSSLQQ